MNRIKGKFVSDQQSDETLKKIRNLLTQNKQIKCSDFSKVSDKLAAKYLQQSFKLLEKESSNPNNLNNPQLVKKKIESASILLADEPPMIKQYVKNKIQSQVFGGRAIKLNDKEYARLTQMRQDLQKKKFDEKKDYIQKLQKMINLAKRYKNQGNTKQIPLLQIEDLVNKQKIDYDSILKEQYSSKSQNNLFNNLETYQQEISISQSLQKQKSLQYRNKQGKIQVQGQQQSQQFYIQAEQLKIDQKFQSLFQKNSTFYQVFKQFLQIQRRKMEQDNKFNGQQHLNYNNYKKPKHIYKFTNKLIMNAKPPQISTNMSISHLSHIYKFKPFTINSMNKDAKNFPLIKKTISKRSGDQTKYHMKQCIIENKTLMYSDEQDGNDIKKQKMKCIDIPISCLEIITAKKQEGNFFQKKVTEIQIMSMRITSKHQSKNFAYQLKYGEGKQLTKQINKINLRRLHKISCILRGANNKYMERIIEDFQQNELDLSERYIRPEEEYPNKQYRQIFIKLILGLIEYLKKVERLNLTKCKLNGTQLQQLLKQCELNFQSITSIDISYTKLDRETLSNVLNLVKKCPKTMSLNLSYCELDDDIIEMNSQNFANVSNKLVNLDLEGNDITSKSVRVLRNALSTKTSQLRSINFNNCSIEEFSQICNFIKMSNKLQNFLANGCKITFSNSKQMEDLLVSTQEKHQLKKIEFKRNLFSGTIKWFEQIGPYLELTIDLSIKSTNTQPLQSKFLKIQFVNK